MSATLISAVAQSDIKLVDTKRGDRLVGEFVTVEGEPVTIWKMPDDEAFAAIRRNQSVKLMKDSRGWNFLDPSVVEQPASVDGLAPDQKRAIAAYIETLADMYAYCHRTASSKLRDVDPGGGECSRCPVSCSVREVQPLKAFVCSRSRFDEL
ncbi:hypothetical protein NDI52_30080 [Leptolyngbya sp. PL-A3]|uniref:hypothetical protein n=1 Tax=Leptolyngbya sp. PL-A3 TaxID=2933911 RepID=UPI00329A6DBF